MARQYLTRAAGPSLTRDNGCPASRTQDAVQYTNSPSRHWHVRCVLAPARTALWSTAGVIVVNRPPQAVSKECPCNGPWSPHFSPRSHPAPAFAFPPPVLRVLVPPFLPTPFGCSRHRPLANTRSWRSFVRDGSSRATHRF